MRPALQQVVIGGKPLLQGMLKAPKTQLRLWQPTHRNGFYAVKVRCFLHTGQCNPLLLREVLEVVAFLLF